MSKKYFYGIRNKREQGNTGKLGTTHSKIQTAQSSPSLVRIEPTMHKSDSMMKYMFHFLNEKDLPTKVVRYINTIVRWDC